MIELTPFTEADWYAFAGAQAPDQGEPFIGSTIAQGQGWTQPDLDEQYITIVVDRICVQVIACESVWRLECCFEDGARTAAAMPNPLGVADLHRLGFLQIA